MTTANNTQQKLLSINQEAQGVFSAVSSIANTFTDSSLKITLAHQIAHLSTLIKGDAESLLEMLQAEQTQAQSGNGNGGGGV